MAKNPKPNPVTFHTFNAARDYAAEHCTGFPNWRVERGHRGDVWYIRLNPAHPVPTYLQETDDLTCPVCRDALLRVAYVDGNDMVVRILDEGLCQNPHCLNAQELKPLTAITRGK